MTSASHEAEAEASASQVVPWCSLITVTYNSRDTLTEFWGDAASMPPGIEWIVVDNNSDDDSASVAKRLGATRVVKSAENLGFSASNNIGLSHARGEFIGFVNPDVRVKFEDLMALRHVAETEAAIVSPQLLNADGTLQPNGRGFPLLLDKIRNRLGGRAGRSEHYLLFATSPSPRNVCWLMGASVFGMRSTIDTFGAWDDHFFLYYEDKDFCLRAWKAGARVLLDPRVTWTHGWARETTELKATPWKREISSMTKFYLRYPEFLLPRGIAARVHSGIAKQVYGDA